MDGCEWMYMGHSSQDSLTDEWIKKTEAFLNEAFARVFVTLCPCGACENRKQQINKDLELLELLSLGNDSDDDIPPLEQGHDNLEKHDSDDETYVQDNPNHDEYF